MTKNEVENLIKRYCYVSEAIEKGLSTAKFYIGNRKKVVNITEEVIKVCELIVLIYESETDEDIKNMIKYILEGRSDVNIIGVLPFEKYSYYSRKDAFFQKVYDCCISKNLVSFEEILKERIA